MRVWLCLGALTLSMFVKSVFSTLTYTYSTAFASVERLDTNQSYPKEETYHPRPTVVCTYVQH